MAIGHALFPAILRDPDAPLDHVALVEQPVYFLESEIGRFGIAEVLGCISEIARR